MLRRDQQRHRSMSIRRFQPQSRNCSICRDRSWQHAMLGLAPSKASSLFLPQERIAHVRRTSFKLLAHVTQHNIYTDLHHKDDQNLPCCFCCWKLRSWIFFMESEACCCCLPSAGGVARSGVASCSFITATIASERRWPTVRVSRRVVDTSCILERRSCTRWLHHSQDSVYLHHASDCQFLRRCFCCLCSWSSP